MNINQAMRGSGLDLEASVRRMLPADERFGRLLKQVAAATDDRRILHHLAACSERLLYSLDLLANAGIAGKRVVELGPAGLGLACANELNCQVTAFDCAGDFFKPVYERHGIPVHHADLNQSAGLGREQYDCILFSEVIEHLARWPELTLRDLYDSLVPGGTLFITTQNLMRLSNRLRLLAGRPIFVNFVPEEMVMGHMREYTAGELGYLLKRAGFKNTDVKMVTFSDLEASWVVQKAYSSLCKLFPNLSNFLFCMARK